MRYALLAILAWHAAAAAAQPQPQPQTKPNGPAALAAIDACIAQLDAALDVGYERIAARCPRLALRLEQSSWAQWLPRGWKEARNDLSAGSLVELRMLVARELEASAGMRGSHRPRVERLNEALVGLGPAAREHSSLWVRFRGWLRTVVDRNRPAQDRGWLDEMVWRNGRSQTVIDLLTYGALGLLLLLAGFVLANELRAAGLSRRRAPVSPGDAALDGKQAARVSWADVERAAPSEKPRLLLELTIDRLTQLRRLPPAGALTVRELTRTVELPDASDRQRLLDVALTAERARYSTSTLTAQAVGATLDQARELLAHLDKQA